MTGRFSVAVSAYTAVLPEPCWVWNGAVSGGYGSLWDGQQVQWAHRVAWESVHGPIPHDMTVDHYVCRNPLCVNPVHMELVSRSENAARGNRHRRKMTCKHGHVLHGDNVGVTLRGRRYCRECKKESNRRSAAKRTAQRRAEAVTA